MKRFQIFILLLSMSLNSFAQTNLSNPLAEKFIRYFNMGNVDTLYTMFSTEMKSAVKKDNLLIIINQIKASMGNLQKSEFLKKGDLAETYLLDFEKPGNVLLLNLNKSNEVMGFFLDQDKRKVVDAPGTVTITTSTATLKGVLVAPNMDSKIPVVLLIAGSGPTDKDGNSVHLGGKSDYLKQLSENLNANNIAVLRYDKRGVGQSTTSKKQDQLVLDDFAEDAVAWIRFLKNDSRFSRVIVAGHSEGALVGIIASLKEKPDAFISLAGPGFQLDKLLKAQLKTTLPPDDFKISSAIIDSIKAGFPIKQKIKPGFEGLFAPSLQTFLHSLLQYNSSTEIAKLNIPVLIVQGTTDLQVEVENAKQLKKSKPDAQLVIIDGMNHIFKEAPVDRNKNIATYSNSNLSIHPKLSPAIVQFVNSVK